MVEEQHETVEINFSNFLPRDESSGVFTSVEAVYQHDGKQWVWTVDNESRARRREVESGRVEGAVIEIVQGLSTGEQVIVAGVSYIREGMLVRPLTKERGL